MKILKTFVGLLIILLISSTVVFSQTNKPTTTKSSPKTTSVTTDQNNTANPTTCNKHQNTKACSSEFVDKNNDGVCDNCGKKKEECMNKTTSTKDGSKSNCCGNKQGPACQHKCNH